MLHAIKSPLGVKLGINYGRKYKASDNHHKCVTNFLDILFNAALHIWCIVNFGSCLVRSKLRHGNCLPTQWFSFDLRNCYNTQAYT